VKEFSNKVVAKQLSVSLVASPTPTHTHTHTHTHLDLPEEIGQAS